MHTEERQRSRERSPGAAPNQPLKKCFISRADPLGQKTESEVKAYREKNQILIKYSASACPPPYFTFEECIQLPKEVQDSFTKAGFKVPSPIQSQSWSILMNGNDMIGIAETGSGKTLAFLIPAIIHIKARTKTHNNPLGLVLAPTRELTAQIMSQFQIFASCANLKAACLYGGQPKGIQKRQLDGGVDVIIACPGRLNDFVESGFVSLADISFLVMDEADRMLDMGFEPQIRKVVSHMRKDRQTVLFSATWPESVQNLAFEFCRERPIHLQIGDHDLAANARITQIIHVVQKFDKMKRLVDVLKGFGPSKYLVFCATKKACENLSQQLNTYGFKSQSIHGDKTQEERDFAIAAFRDGTTKCLIATDVAQRGLDVKDVQYVVNYDMTKQIEDYVHRIGRTGRAGKTGTAITFFVQEEDFKLAYPLVQFLQSVNQQVPPELQSIASGPGGGGGYRGGFSQNQDFGY